MSNYYDYKYYIDGRKIAILQKLTDTSQNPRILVDGDYYGNPQSADTSAIYLRYTVSQSAPTSENDELSVNANLAMAILHYVKARYAEESMNDIKANRYHMNEFYKYIARESNDRRGHIRTVMAGYTGAIK